MGMGVPYERGIPVQTKAFRSLEYKADSSPPPESGTQRESDDRKLSGLPGAVQIKTPMKKIGRPLMVPHNGLQKTT